MGSIPGEIEFLDGGDGPDRRDEDPPEFGPRQRWQRWGVVVGAIAAALTLHGGTQPQAAPTAPGSQAATLSDRVSVMPPPAPTPPAPTSRVPNPAAG